MIGSKGKDEVPFLEQFLEERNEVRGREKEVNEGEREGEW